MKAKLIGSSKRFILSYSSTERWEKRQIRWLFNVCSFPNVLIFVLQVAELYRNQQQIQNQQKSEKEEVEDFY